MLDILINVLLTAHAFLMVIELFNYFLENKIIPRRYTTNLLNIKNILVLSDTQNFFLRCRLLTFIHKDLALHLKILLLGSSLCSTLLQKRFKYNLHKLKKKICWYFTCVLYICHCTRPIFQNNNILQLLNSFKETPFTDVLSIH